MRRGRDLEPVDGFQCDIQGTVDADSDFGTAQIVVDGGGHADHRKSLLPKCPGSGLRAVSTDHNQRIDVALMKNLDGFPLGLFLLEFFATPAAQKGSAALDDVAYVAEPKLDEIVFEQTGIPVPHADGFPAPVNPGTNDRPHSGIHARCVTTTGKYRDAFHSGFLQSNPGTQSRSHTSARAQNAWSSLIFMALNRMAPEFQALL